MPLLTFPWPQILSADGSTYPGAKLFFYETGTSTLATTYSDAGLTTPHTNPVVADATGVFPPIYLANKRYKLVLRTAGDVTLFTADPVNDAAAYNVSTIAAMTAITAPTNGTSVVVTDIHRGGTFIFDTSATSAGDGGTTFSPDDATTGSWVRQYSGPIDVMWFGATGDGVANDTSEIQDAIDAAVAAGASLHFPAGTYLVSKNPALTGFPNSDQPCLLIRDATKLRVSGHGAKLKVNVHAQGILEIQESSDLVIDGLEFEGRGNFPQLDGTTGRGEKGTATDGYNTTGFWTYYKNNSYATNARTDGGFSGAFPQDGGGTAGTWGTWGGGYIGNMGIGLLIHNDCHNITVRDCKATGFNYAGFGIGHNGDFFPTDLSYPDCTNITFTDCHATGNYNAGISIMAVNGFQVRGCNVSDNGHPSAVPLTNTYADPGYGWTAQSTTYSAARNGRVSSCIANDNIRKGLDVHAGTDITLTDNIVKGNAVCGIFSDWSSTSDADLETSGIVISNNVLSGNAFAPINLYGIYVNGPGASGIPCDTVVEGNVLEDSYSGGIRIRYASNVTVANNVLRGSAAGGGAAQAFIDCQSNNGSSAVDENVLIIGNQIFDSDDEIDFGIRVSYDYADAIIANNVVKMEGASASAGITLNTCTGVHVFNNVVRLGAAGTPIAAAQTNGLVYGNRSYGGATASTLVPTTKSYARPVDSFSFTVTFDGTSSPAISDNTAPTIVTASTATSTSYGFSVPFVGLSATGQKFRAAFAVRSSGGIDFTSYVNPYIYVRGISNTAVEIGMKSAPDGSDAPAASASSGEIDVFVFLH